MHKEFKDINFSQEDINVINLYQPLADWFSKLNFLITRMDLHHPHFVSYFNKYPVNSERLQGGANRDILVLEKMTTAAMCWIQSIDCPNIEKAINAGLVINKIYEEYKDELSEEALNSLKIDVGSLGDKMFEEELYSSKMRDLEIAYLESKKQSLIDELTHTENRLAELHNESNIKK